MRRLRGWAAYGCAIICGVAVFVSEAEASPQSRALIREGVTAMQAGDAKTAEARFRAALRADPSDSDALVHLAALANRYGNWRAAYNLARSAKALKNNHPDLDFELGWAELETERFQAAITSLERYDAAHPGRALTEELLGRAELALGQIAKAKARFEDVAARDPNLRPNALYYLAQIQSMQGANNDAARTLARLSHESPDSPMNRVLLEKAAQVEPSQPKFWSLTFLGGIGYNDNVIGTDDGVPLPPEITGRASGFWRAALDGSVTVYREQGRRLALGYTLQRDRYLRAGLHQYDVTDHYPHIDASIALTPELAAGLRIGDELTYVGGKKFRESYDGRVSLAWRAHDWAVIEGAVRLQHMDYRQPPPFAVQDRTGDAYGFTVTAYLTPPNRWGIEGYVGWSHGSNDTDGTDFRNDSDVILAGASMPLPWKIDAVLNYSHSFDRYSEVNSFAGPFGNGFNRSDDIDALTLQFTRPIVGPVSAFGRYDYVNNSSNINLYRYEQNVITTGLIARF